MLPTLQVVVYVFMCGGPFSLWTSNDTVNLRFNAISWTMDIGDLISEFIKLSLQSETSPFSDPHLLVFFEVSGSVSGFKTSRAL
jgi:hypothetical protein